MDRHKKYYCYVYYKGPYSTIVHGTIPQNKWLEERLLKIAFDEDGVT